MDSAFLGVAIGLVLVFAVLSGLVSTITEAIARFLGLRGEYLLRGLRTMVTSGSAFKLPLFRKPAPDPSTKSVALKAVLSHPLMQADGKHGRFDDDAGNKALTRKERRALPSYISARAFSTVLLELVVPDAEGKTRLDGLQKEADKIGDERLKQVVATLIEQTKGDVEQLRKHVEDWYDEHMARVSGWYKRHVRWISVAVALVLVLSFNVNAVRIGWALYLNEPLRTAVLAEAARAEPCDSDDPRECLKKARDQIAPLEEVGLPIGWTEAPECLAGLSCDTLERFGLTDPERGVGHDLLRLGLVLLGFAILVLATVPGARFWFDALSRLNSLRSTGPKPPTPRA
jgi:hypothetical protein